ncbi:MAG: PilZ domain-containing protein [Desulfobacterales bacterium]
MKTTVEKRACERHRYAADIAFSYFNKEHSYNARTLNLCTGGMCFKSNLFLKPGATVYIRLKTTHPNGSCSGYCEGLHLVTLAEVKWCQEANGTDAFPYGVGVKYFEAAY